MLGMHCQINVYLWRKIIWNKIIRPETRLKITDCDCFLAWPAMSGLSLITVGVMEDSWNSKYDSIDVFLQFLWPTTAYNSPFKPEGEEQHEVFCGRACKPTTLLLKLTGCSGIIWLFLQWCHCFNDDSFWGFVCIFVLNSLFILTMPSVQFSR